MQRREYFDLFGKLTAAGENPPLPVPGGVGGILPCPLMMRRVLRGPFSDMESGIPGERRQRDFFPFRHEPIVRSKSSRNPNKGREGGRFELI